MHRVHVRLPGAGCGHAQTLAGVHLLGTAEESIPEDRRVSLAEFGAGSDRGAARAAAMYILIGTARLVDVLGPIAETPQTRLDQLQAWNSELAPQRDLAA